MNSNLLSLATTMSTRSRTLVFVALVASLLNGCGMTRVYLSGVNEDEGSRIGSAHPELTLRDDDVDVEIVGDIFTVMDHDVVETRVAQRLRTHLAAKPRGTSSIRTQVIVTVPTHDAIDEFSWDTAQKTMRVESHSVLPDGREVVTRSGPVFIDAGSGLSGRSAEATVLPAIAGTLLFGALGTTAVSVIMASFIVPALAGPGGESIRGDRTALLYIGGLAAFGMALPMIAGLLGLIPISAGATGVIWAQSERAEEILSDALRAHAYDIQRALEHVEQPDAPDEASVVLDEAASLNTMQPTATAPDTTPEAPLDAASTAASVWVMDVDDELGCVDAVTLHRELQAWVPLDTTSHRVVRVRTEALPSGRVKVLAQVEREATAELLADKQVEVARADCTEVERLLAQSLRRQLQ